MINIALPHLDIDSKIVKPRSRDGSCQRLEKEEMGSPWSQGTKFQCASSTCSEDPHCLVPIAVTVYKEWLKNIVNA